MELTMFYKNLSREEQKAYAVRAKTTDSYMRNHIIPGRKVPRKGLLRRLSDASHNLVSYREVIEHFYYKEQW